MDPNEAGALALKIAAGLGVLLCWPASFPGLWPAQTALRQNTEGVFLPLCCYMRAIDLLCCSCHLQFAAELPPSPAHALQALRAAREAPLGTPGRFDDSISLITKLFSSPDALHAAFWPQPGSSSSRAPSPPPCQALAQAQAQAQGGVSAGRPSSSLHGPARSDTGTAAGAHASTHKPTRAPGPSAGSLQLDWAALQELYAAVLDPAPGSAAGSRQLASGLSAALQALLGALSSHSPSSQALANPGLLRQVAVLLACPLLEQPEYGSLVSAAATCLTSSLDSKAQGWLVDMWSNGEAYATGQLRRLVMALQQFVNISVRRSSAAGLRGAAAAQGWTGPGPWGSLGVEGAVRLLSLLHRANARRGPMALSLHEFYNPSVNDDALFSIKEDFKRWKAPHRYPFSFCAYPFLYDPASKARVLTYENKTRQYEELNASLFRGLFASVTAAQIGGGAAGGPDGPGGPHGGGSGPELCPFLVLKVRRGPSLLGDTLVQIGRAKEQGCLAKPLKVKFVGEEGVDEGGVQKEFFSLLLR